MDFIYTWYVHLLLCNIIFNRPESIILSKEGHIDANSKNFYHFFVIIAIYCLQPFWDEMHESLTFDLVENIWPWPLMYRQIYIYHSDMYVWRLKHYNSICYRWHYRHSERIDVYNKLILVVFTNIWNYHIVCIRKQTKAIMYECQH